jgi:hypothetical protein
MVSSAILQRNISRVGPEEPTITEKVLDRTKTT